MGMPSTRCNVYHDSRTTVQVHKCSTYFYPTAMALPNEQWSSVWGQASASEKIQRTVTVSLLNNKLNQIKRRDFIYT